MKVLQHKWTLQNSLDLLIGSPDVIWWTKNHKIRIPYVYNDIIHHYIPDFLIRTNSKTIIEEIKGYIKDKSIFKLKCEAANKYCQENNIEYIISYDNHIKK